MRPSIYTLVLMIWFSLAAAAEAEAESRPADADEAAVDERTTELQRRETALAELRDQLGLYHPALAEAYGELGGLQLELEDFEQSLATYQDALEVARINNGLYSEAQLRIIDGMIAANEGLAAWEAVEDLHEFRYHMAGRLWELADSRHLAAVAVWGGWKTRAIRDGLLGGGAWGVRSAIDDAGSVYRRAIAALEQEPPGRPLELATLIRGKAELDVHMLRAVAATPYNYFPASVPRYVNQVRCRMIPGPNGQAVRRCVNVQVENPRYLSSQRNNKRTTLMRYSNAVNDGIERLSAIRDEGAGLSPEAAAEIDAQVARLEAEYQAYFRRGRRDLLF